jgi:hypothetical protein
MVFTTLFLLAAVCTCAAAADPVDIRDDKGRVILQSSGKDKTIHTYSPDGKRVRSINNQGKRVDYDKRGVGGATTEDGLTQPQAGGSKR